MAIAALAAIESLLCAAVLDSMTRTKHNANGELVGQGLGDMVVPFFGGFVATAAIARSAANVRAGACSPLASAFHALTILAGILLLAELLAYISMAVMTGLLLMVAWNISEAKHLVMMVRRAPHEDVVVLLVCLGLTVFLDMVVAIAVGIVLASLLFIRTMAEQTHLSVMDHAKPRLRTPLPEGIRVYPFNGPLFFAAAERAVGTLRLMPEDVRRIIFYMDSVPVIDASGAVAPVGVIEDLLARGVEVTLADLPPKPRQVLLRTGLNSYQGRFTFTDTLHEAVEHAASLQPAAVSPLPST